MGIGKKITKGIIGSGVNLSHKAPPMSGETGRLLNNMPLLKNNSGPGNYGGLQVEKSGIVGKGFMKAKQSYGGTGNFGELSVKAGIDNNPKPTQADRIAGAKSGGLMKTKKFKLIQSEGLADNTDAVEGTSNHETSIRNTFGKNSKKKSTLPLKNKLKDETPPPVEIETPRSLVNDGKKVKTASTVKKIKREGVKPVSTKDSTDKDYTKKEVDGKIVGDQGSSSKIKASTLKTDVKKETDIEKAKRLTVESGKKSGLSEKTKSLSRKAKRLEKKSKRKAGRAERKEIKKDAKDGKISRMKKRADIRASRKKQKK